jgi:hypothetical protein
MDKEFETLAAEAIAQAGISAIGTHLWDCECGEQFEDDCKVIGEES